MEKKPAIAMPVGSRLRNGCYTGPARTRGFQSLKRERVVLCQMGGLAGRIFLVYELGEFRKAVIVAGQVFIGVSQRRRSGGDDLSPTEVQLESQPIQKQNRTPDRKIIHVG